jgi:hypothetical protein
LRAGRVHRRKVDPQLVVGLAGVNVIKLVFLVTDEDARSAGVKYLRYQTEAKNMFSPKMDKYESNILSLRNVFQP